MMQPSPFTPPPYAERVVEGPPRTGRSFAVAGLVAAAFAATLVPWVVTAIATHSGSGAFRIVKEGGAFSWLVLFVHFIALVVIGVGGGFFVVGRRVPAWGLGLVACAPTLVGVTGAAAGHRTMIRAISGTSLDPLLRSRIVAQGMSEEQSCLMLGATASAIALGVVALACVMRLLTIDAAAVDPGRTRGAIGSVAATLGAGFLALVLAITVRFATSSQETWLGMTVVLATCVVALVAAWRAPLGMLVDRDERSTEVVPVVAALAASAALAVVLADLVSVLLLRRTGLGAVAESSVNPSQRTRLLAEIVLGIRASRIVAGVDAGAVAMVSLVPLFFVGADARRNGLGFRVGTLVWPGAGVVLALAILLQEHASVASLASLRRAVVADVPGLALPTTRTAWEREVSDGPMLFVPRNGSLMVDADRAGASPVPATPSALAAAFAPHASAYVPEYDTYDARPAPHTEYVPIAVDPSTTYAAFTRAVAPALAPHRELGVVFVLAPEVRPNRAVLGNLAPLAGSDYSTLGMRVAPAQGSARDAASGNVVTVRIDGAAASVFLSNGSRAHDVSSEPGPGHDAERVSAVTAVGTNERIVEVAVAPGDADDLAAVFRFAEAARVAFTPNVAIVLSGDRRSSEERAASSASGASIEGPPTLGAGGFMRSGAVAVNGRLAPEVIQRIVRAHTTAPRTCYERALVKNPRLEGRVTTKFVIARDGSVASAVDGGSDLPDAECVKCVVHSFTSLTFPAPEGGIVTVSYPMVFQSAK